MWISEPPSSIDKRKRATKPHPAIIVLKSLLLGIPVIIDGRKYQLDEGNVLCIEMYKIKLDENGDFTDGRIPVMMRLAGELPEFIEICARATDDELYLIGCNIVLNE